MRFHHAEWGFLFALLPLFLALKFWSAWKRKKNWDGFADLHLRNRLLPGNSPFRHRSKAILQSLALIFLVLALMEPQWGTREEEVRTRGIHLIVAVDVSDSMLAEDIKPSRMARARYKLQDLLPMLRGDRVGLVAFAGRSFLLSPLTSDYGTLKRYIEELTTTTIPVAGTDLAGALTLAIKSLPQDKDQAKAILILSDGEDHSERLENVIRELQKNKIRVFSLGMGTLEGAPIPEASGGFKKNLEGEMVVSKLKEDSLKDLSLRTEGAYARAVRGDEDLKALYLKGIRGVMDPNELQVTHKKVWESRFYWPLSIALFLLAADALIAPGRPKKTQNKNFNTREDSPS